MSKPKNQLAKNPPAAEQELTAGAAAEPEITAVSLGAKQHALLDRTSRFLVNITSPSFARRARREGYTAEEHRTGWRLWRTAAGEDRPIDHVFAEQEAAGAGDGEGMALLQAIDEFENLWFPRCRAIIRRVVARDRRDKFAEAFFKDLSQQPLGPGVVGSVGTFLTRVDGLKDSKDPDAKKVRDTLRARGLTDGAMRRVRGLLDQFETLSGPKKKAAAGPSPAEIAAAQAAQVEAQEALRDWLNDWATTLRPVFNVREQIQLGLAVVRRGGGVVVDEEEEAGAEGDGEAPAGS